MDEFWDSNFGMDDRATGVVLIPVMSSCFMNLLEVYGFDTLLVAGWTAARTED